MYFYDFLNRKSFERLRDAFIFCYLSPHHRFDDLSQLVVPAVAVVHDAEVPADHGVVHQAAVGDAAAAAGPGLVVGQRQLENVTLSSESVCVASILTTQNMLGKKSALKLIDFCRSFICK